MIRDYHLFLILILLCLAQALLPLQREQHQGKYEIGSINSLKFFKDKIFFRSDDDIFGFLDQKDGQLLTVYQLELGQKIVHFASGYEVVIARQKKLNMFWPYQGQYVRSYETRFLQKHPEFTKIVDYQKSQKGGLILTDKYLILVPPSPRGTKLQDLKEKILVELLDPTEAFFGLVHLYNIQEKKLEDILVSLLQNDKVKQVCFRRMGEKIVRQCLDLNATDSVEDVVASGQFIFVQLAQGALVIDEKLALLERLDTRPTQYFQGMVTLGQDNQFYAPMMKAKFDLLLIEHSGKPIESFMGLKVEDTLLSVKNMTRKPNSTDFQTVSSIAKKAEETPRKVWSFSGDNEQAVRVYIQFEQGKLVCYSLDLTKKTMQEIWEFTTIQAQKVVTGELQAQDIEQDGQDQADSSDKPEKKIAEKEVNSNADITQKIAP